MIFSPKEFAELLRMIADDCEKELPNIAKKGYFNAIAQFKKRIPSGETASGGSFSNYTTKYSDLREKRGYSKKKNFSFSNEMWRTFTGVSLDSIPFEIESSGDEIIVFGTPKKEASDRTPLISYLQQTETRRGGERIIALSDDEAAKVAAAIESNIKRCLSDVL